jgi:hypothetical protein
MLFSVWDLVLGSIFYWADSPAAIQEAWDVISSARHSVQGAIPAKYGTCSVELVSG